MKSTEQKIMNLNGIFDGSQIDTRVLYMHEFSHIPSTHYMHQVDGARAFPTVKELLMAYTTQIYQQHWFKRAKGNINIARLSSF